MARRRKAKYTWFPTIGSEDIFEEQDLAGYQFFLSANTNSAVETAIRPLTFDRPAEPDEVSADDPGVLAGIVGQEWFLRRIVGKIHLGMVPQFTPDNIGATAKQVLVGAGFFVARASDDAAAGGDLPIGAQDPDELRESYSPLMASTIREPWIWRRTWILQNPAIQALFYGGAGSISALNSLSATGSFATWPGNWPTTNAEYGSVADGPHIDVKCARRIGQDERLWFALSTTQFPTGPLQAPLTAAEVEGFLDFRLLGQLRKARNRGVF